MRKPSQPFDVKQAASDFVIAAYGMDPEVVQDVLRGIRPQIITNAYHRRLEHHRLLDHASVDDVIKAVLTWHTRQ